ncbi:MAG: general stress protein CsbD [Ignavibacteriales bacterium]|nr:MAG: general stress protein CsbD [Ignavibacteriales bacterium]RPI76100.1 MAG: general stress protein CsbD [Ignavibacteriales bacterium]RPI76478.1 MAG: general stress protein CsbD [Ignavibacteriales bacterium]
MKKNEAGFIAEKKEKFRQKFPAITDKDLHFQEGKEREMIEMLGYKLGKTNQELLSIIIEL